MTFQLPDLDYEYTDLEPHIDARTMETHHAKHHQGYINKANAILAGTAWENTSSSEIVTHLDDLPEEIRTGARDNVGGVCNHSFFWKCLSPHGGGAPHGELAESIDEAFGSFGDFKEQFTAAAVSQFGSGWAWLVEKDGKIEIITTSNQDSPLTLGYTRLLALDVWEHAYYLNYQNRRPDYIDAFWNVVNWGFVEAKYNNSF